MRLAFLGFVQQNMQSDVITGALVAIGLLSSISLEQLNVSDLIRLSLCLVRFHLEVLLDVAWVGQVTNLSSFSNMNRSKDF
jgi:hypothetical protein